MVRASRIGYALRAWAFVGGLLAQVFFIGLGLFADPTAINLHRDLGWILHLAPVLVLLLAALSRAGARHWQWALALAVVVFLVPIFATLRASAPVLAALHPVAAVISFAIAVVVAVNSVRALRRPLDVHAASVRDEPAPI